MPNVNEILALESRINQLIADIRNDICERVENEGFEGVKTLSKNPNCFIVSFKTINANGSVLSAEYYSQPKQAEYVRCSLEPAKTLHAVIKKLREIVETRQVKIGANKHAINPVTINVINSFLEEIKGSESCDN